MRPPGGVAITAKTDTELSGITTHVIGRPYYNSSTEELQFWNGFRWISMGGTETRDDMNVYLDTTNGSDDNDGSSVANAFATFNRAVRQWKRNIHSKVNLRIKAGTYTDNFPLVCQWSVHGDGQLTWEGIDPPTQIAGPFTVTGVTSYVMSTNNLDIGWEITVSGAGWTVDAYAGKFIRYTNGNDMTDRIVPVHRNGTDSILHTATITYAPDIPKVGTTFVVIEPSVKVVLTHDGTTVFDLRSNGTRRGANFIFANIEFSNSVTSFNAFQFVNTGKMMTGLTKFHSKAQYNATVSMHGGGMNSSTFVPEDRTQLVNQQLIVSRQMFGAWYLNWPSMVLENTYGDTLDGVNPALRMSGTVNAAYDGTTILSHFINRGGTDFLMAGGDLGSCILETVLVDHQAVANLSLMMVDGVESNSVIVDDGSLLNMQQSLVNRSGGKAFSIQTNSRVQLDTVNITSANVPGDHFYIGCGSEIVCVGTCNFIGAANKVEFKQSTAAAGATVNDTIPTAPGRIYDKDTATTPNWLGSHLMTTT